MRQTLACHFPPIVSILPYHLAYVLLSVYYALGIVVITSYALKLNKYI